MIRILLRVYVHLAKLSLVLHRLRHKNTRILQKSLLVFAFVIAGRFGSLICFQFLLLVCWSLDGILQCTRPEGSIHAKFQNGGSKWRRNNEIYPFITPKPVNRKAPNFGTVRDMSEN